MAKFERHIFVCTNSREPGSARPSCTANGQSQLHTALKDAVRSAGLGGSIRVNKAGCLDQCEHGPTVVVYPEAIWYGHVTAADVAEIVDSHILKNRAVQRLQIGDLCLNNPECEHRRGPCT